MKDIIDQIESAILNGIEDVMDRYEDRCFNGIDGGDIKFEINGEHFVVTVRRSARPIT
jgi:hypothetical protein